MRRHETRARRVGIQAYLWGEVGTYRQSGVSGYIRHLVRGLAGVPGLDEALVYLPSPAPLAELPTVPHLQGRTPWLPLRRPSQRILWEHAVFPFLLWKDRVDLLHAPMNVAPWWTPCPVVVTIVDLAYMRYPYVHPRGRRLYLTAFTRLTVRRARAVIAISDYTREEVVRLLGVPRERIHVTHLGVDGDFRPLPPDQVEAFRRQRGLPERYLLYLGNLEPRKNLPRLVQAYARTGLDIPLVLAGAKGWSYSELFRTVESLDLAGQVLFPGFVPREELPLWYNGATAFLYPSLYEGFGLPPLEAMACGTPVLVSNTSSLPEVVGEAGILVPPDDVEAMAGALQRLVQDTGLRARLRQQGLERTRLFTWERMAQQTVALYQRVLSPDTPADTGQRGSSRAGQG
jgi:glycosyltransferase involved in cell wall biosynthesis